MRSTVTFVVLIVAFVVEQGLAQDDFTAVQVEQQKPDELAVEYDGLIEPSRVVDLSAPVDGILETVSVERGDMVRSGQILATLEARVEKATLALAKARTELVGPLKRQRAQLKYHLIKLAHDGDLYRQGILSVDEFEVSKTEKLVAEAAVLEAEENLRLAGLAQKRAEAVLELRSIRSPINGVVIERHLSTGELVTRQYQSKILAVAQVDPLRVEVMLPGALFGQIAVGIKALVKTKDLAEGHAEARVTIVDRVIDAGSNTFRVSLELSNSENRLPAGLRCRVKFLPALENERQEPASVDPVRGDGDGTEGERPPPSPF